jgi:hypothetical protein
VHVNRLAGIEQIVEMYRAALLRVHTRFQRAGSSDFPPQKPLAVEALSKEVEVSGYNK